MNIYYEISGISKGIHRNVHSTYTYVNGINKALVKGSLYHIQLAILQIWTNQGVNDEYTKVQTYVQTEARQLKQTCEVFLAQHIVHQLPQLDLAVPSLQQRLVLVRTLDM